MNTYLIKETVCDEWVVYEVTEDLSQERWIAQDNILDYVPDCWESLDIKEFCCHKHTDVITRDEFESLIFTESL